jgi:VanZ family protein
MIKLLHDHWWRISFFVLVAITILSLLPLDSLPTAPESDKTHHFIAYALLAMPIALRQHARWRQLLLLCFLWSGVIEMIQPYVNRYGEWADLLANGCGLLMGYVLGWCGRRYRAYFD